MKRFPVVLLLAGLLMIYGCGGNVITDVKTITPDSSPIVVEDSAQ
ncbi:MAG: hypothetical protein RSB97_07700 [Christensenella sp.]